MIDCSKKNLIEFCAQKEIDYLPLLELDVLGNKFMFYETLHQNNFLFWLQKKFNTKPTKSNNFFFGNIILLFGRETFKIFKIFVLYTLNLKNIYFSIYYFKYKFY